MNNVISSVGGNIAYAKETNFSLLNTDTDIWEGELPYKPGSEFPTPNIKNRADKLKTARLLFYNDSESIFESLISIFPEIDPTTGWQIRELVANIPQFKNCINSWVGVLVGKMPIIDCRNDQYDLLVSKVLDSSNLTQFVFLFIFAIIVIRMDVGHVFSLEKAKIVFISLIPLYLKIPGYTTSTSKFLHLLLQFSLSSYPKSSIISLQEGIYEYTLY